MVVDYPACSVEDRGNFERSFQQLMRLQALCVNSITLCFIGSDSNHRRKTVSQDAPSEPPYPLQALVQPLSLRFKYHFEGTRKTNKVDKVSACLFQLI